MPNWCNNTLIISHPDKSMMKRLVKGYNQNRMLDEFIPIPQELKDGAMTMERLRMNLNDDYRKELEKVREDLNVKYFGYKSWYEFCVSEWGTKWDIGRGDSFDTVKLKDIKGDTITLRFDSAWSFPIGAYEKLKDLGFYITAMYYEGGCAFCGIWSDGLDDCYSIEGKSDWVRMNIPSEIDQEFCISENMAMWEAESAEEEDAKA